jgi:alpha-beta hydrolase superfamily lysophospholipase
MTLPVLSTLGSADQQLAVYDWPLYKRQPAAPQRGTVLLVHGLGEHMGRYAHVAQQLNAWGFDVRGYDHHGHGLSSGARGTLPTPHRLLDDLARVIDHTRVAMPQQTHRLILLGHSLGGLVVARAVAEQLRPVDGLVMSSPALRTDINWLQKMLLATLPHVAPQLCVDNGLDARWVARNTQLVRAYENDPLVHRKISAALGVWILDQGAATLAQAAQWQVPTLLLYAGQDRLVNPAGSALFAQRAPSHLVTTHVYPAMYHEIFNDPEVDQVFADLRAWLMRLDC